MTDDGPTNDIEKRLREKIEQEIERRRQARLDSDTVANDSDSQTPAPSATEEAVDAANLDAPSDTMTPQQDIATLSSDEDTTVDVQEEEPPAEAVSEIISDDSAPSPDTAAADDIPEVTVPVVEDDIPEVTVPVVEDDIPEVTVPVVEDDIPEVAAPVVEDDIPEVTVPVVEDDIPEVAAAVVEVEPVPEVIPVDKDIPKDDSAKRDPNEKSDAPATAEDSEKSTNAEAKPGGSAGRKTKTASGLAPRKKKKDTLADFGKGPSKKTGTGKTVTGIGRTKGPSTTRSLSDNEQRLLEEKAKIDAKFRKQKMILYPAITIGTLILFVLMYFAATFVRDYRSGSKKTPAPSSNTGSTAQQSHPQPQQPAPAQSVYASWTDLDNAVEKLVTVHKDPAAAIIEIKRFAKTHPDNETLCTQKVTSITETYLEKDLCSLDWKAMQPQMNLGMKSSNPGDVALAISRFRSFATSHPKEFFIADYMIKKLEDRYAKMTGGLMP